MVVNDTMHLSKPTEPHRAKSESFTTSHVKRDMQIKMRCYNAPTKGQNPDTENIKCW